MDWIDGQSAIVNRRAATVLRGCLLQLMKGAGIIEPPCGRLDRVAWNPVMEADAI
jgi:hypothetical protein